jgi:hypothetical protein
MNCVEPNKKNVRILYIYKINNKRDIKMINNKARFDRYKIKQTQKY